MPEWPWRKDARLRRILQEPPALDRSRLKQARIRLVLLVIAFALVYSVFGILMSSSYRYTSLLFVGLPAILAVIVTLSPPAKSTHAAVAKAITLMLLLTGIFAVEGLICILVAAPLFYLVGLGVASGIDFFRDRREGDGKSGAHLIVALPLLLLSLEGVMPVTTWDRSETVWVSRLVDAEPAEVESAIESTPHFSKSLPPFLALFPGPTTTSGTGNEVGARRVIGFEDGEDSFLELEVKASRPGRLVFEVVRDTTEHGGFAELERSTVSWKESSRGRTLVTWTLEYDRNMDPAFYFGPLQRSAMRAMGGYLIETVATPR